jgi:hypothetical protein
MTEFTHLLLAMSEAKTTRKAMWAKNKISIL